MSRVGSPWLLVSTSTVIRNAVFIFQDTIRSDKPSQRGPRQLLRCMAWENGKLWCLAIVGLDQPALEYLPSLPRVRHIRVGGRRQSDLEIRRKPHRGVWISSHVVSGIAVALGPTQQCGHPVAVARHVPHFRKSVGVDVLQRVIERAF